MQSLPQVGCAVSGDRSDREQLMHKCLRVRLGDAEGIGKEGDGLAHLLGNAVMALLNIPQHPGLKGTVRLLRIPLDAVDAARVKVSAQISQIVERIGMGPDLYQAGVCHLPAHIPAEEVVSGHVLHIHHNRDHGFHLVCLKQREEQLAVTDEVLDGLDCADIPRLTVYNKCDKPGAMSFDPDILLTSAKTGYGLDTLLAKLDEVLSDRVHTLKVLLPYDKLGLAAPMRERGSVQVEEYREDGLYLEGIVKTEDLHCFEGYLV